MAAWHLNVTTVIVQQPLIVNNVPVFWEEDNQRRPQDQVAGKEGTQIEGNCWSSKIDCNWDGSGFGIGKEEWGFGILVVSKKMLISYLLKMS